MTTSYAGTSELPVGPPSRFALRLGRDRGDTVRADVACETTSSSVRFTGAVSVFCRDIHELRLLWPTSANLTQPEDAACLDSHLADTIAWIHGLSAAQHDEGGRLVAACIDPYAAGDLKDDRRREAACVAGDWFEENGGRRVWVNGRVGYRASLRLRECRIDAVFRTEDAVRRDDRNGWGWVTTVRGRRVEVMPPYPLPNETLDVERLLEYNAAEAVLRTRAKGGRP